MQQSIRLKHEPSSEPLHDSAKYSFTSNQKPTIHPCFNGRFLRNTTSSQGKSSFVKQGYIVHLRWVMALPSAPPHVSLAEARSLSLSLSISVFVSVSFCLCLCLCLCLYLVFPHYFLLPSFGLCLSISPPGSLSCKSRPLTVGSTPHLRRGLTVVWTTAGLKTVSALHPPTLA